jgi:hypothetical protein
LCDNQIRHISDTTELQPPYPIDRQTIHCDCSGMKHHNSPDKVQQHRPSAIRTQPTTTKHKMKKSRAIELEKVWRKPSSSNRLVFIIPFNIYRQLFCLLIHDFLINNPLNDKEEIPVLTR